MLRNVAELTNSTLYVEFRFLNTKTRSHLGVVFHNEQESQYVKLQKVQIAIRYVGVLNS